MSLIINEEDKLKKDFEGEENKLKGQNFGGSHPKHQSSQQGLFGSRSDVVSQSQFKQQPQQGKSYFKKAEDFVEDQIVGEHHQFQPQTNPGLFGASSPRSGNKQQQQQQPQSFWKEPEKYFESEHERREREQESQPPQVQPERPAFFARRTSEGFQDNY